MMIDDCQQILPTFYRDDMNNANAPSPQTAHGGNIILVSSVVQVCRCCVCAHVTIQTGAISGQERRAIPATGQLVLSLCRASRWEDGFLLLGSFFAWALAAAVRWSLCMNSLLGLALCLRVAGELMGIPN
jgi:hypothetical protein